MSDAGSKKGLKKKPIGAASSSEERMRHDERRMNALDENSNGAMKRLDEKTLFDEKN